MTSGYDPFAPPPGDPFGTPPPVTYGGQVPGAAAYGTAPGHFGQPASNTAGYNTFAVLSPIFAVIVPPAGVVLGHLALPQIQRSGQQGRTAAISGLIIGYLMCVVLIAAGLYWLTDSGSSTTSKSSSTSSPIATVSAAPPPPIVTSIAPPTNAPQVKLDLATVPVGACVTIQMRSTARTDALDLYQADCRHSAGVYTVAARVGSSNQCKSDYVAAPPDLSFALCLNPY